MLTYLDKGLQKESVQPLVPLRRLRMTTKVMKGFMKVISVILCLIISTTVYTGSISTTAYAESILWSTKHSSTNLIKDEEWLALLAEEPDANPPAEDVEASSLEITMDDLKMYPQEETVGMEPQDIPKAVEDTLAEPPMEDIVDYISATPGELAPDDVIDKTGENQSS